MSALFLRRRGVMDELALRTIFVESRPASRRLRKARLVVLDGPDEGQQAVVNKHTTYVGRSAVNDLVLADSKVSARHLELEVVEDGYVLRDLDSTNGTFFAGARIREIYLRPEMVFTVGSTRVRFEPTDDVVEIPLSERSRFGQVTGNSLQMREIFALMEKVAPSELTVLIGGETGTGKERLARSIHHMSRRSAGAYVVLDCSAIPRDLAESTVFGHERGAFTGAVASHPGAFEQADGGTIFLDEVGELPLDLQPKLLRVLENREIRRVGGDRSLQVDVRVVAATNRDLRQMVADGTFREDLFFRLSVIQCRLPALRERTGDVPLLAEELLETFADRRPDLGPLRLAPDARAALASYTWPGNVRELKNVLERAVSLADTAELRRGDLLLGSDPRTARPTAPRITSAAAETSSSSGEGTQASSRLHTELTIDTSLDYKDAKQEVIDHFEARYLQWLMETHGGNLSRAAREVALTRFHLRELLKKHDLLAAFRRGD